LEPLSEKYKIKTQLVSEALFGESYCNAIRGKSKLPGCTGYINNDKDHIGRAFLTFCFSKIFHIHLLYGYEEGFLENTTAFFRVREAFSKLTIEEIDEAIEDLRQLYIFTQERLQDRDSNGSQSIKLVRALRPFEIEQIVGQYLDGCEEITYKTNIISSYAAENRLFHYLTCVSIERLVKMENIAIYYKFLEYPGDVCKFYPQSGGEYEVWVKNEHPLRHLTLKNEQFHIIQDAFIKEYVEPYKKKSTFEQNRSGNEPFSSNAEWAKMTGNFFKPCIDDRLVKRVMKFRKHI
jgi:hypothetical protein